MAKEYKEIEVKVEATYWTERYTRVCEHVTVKLPLIVDLSELVFWQTLADTAIKNLRAAIEEREAEASKQAEEE